MRTFPRMRFKIDWRESFDGAPCTTLGSIVLLIDELPVWPVVEEGGDFEWFADELLAHLTECWKPLVLRQTYPIPVQPSRPSFLMVEAIKRWSSLPEALVESEKRDLAAFEDVHNLANAFGGVSGLLPLWFLRSCDRVIIDTQERFFEVPYAAAIVALSDAGDDIARRLARTQEKKWSRLLDAWKHRDRSDGVRLLALTIGRDRETAEELIREKVLTAPLSFEDAANDNDELRIAARMAGPIQVNQIRTVIKQLRECEPRSVPELKKVSIAARAMIESRTLKSERPYVQGNELAKWLRAYLNVSSTGKVDPYRVLWSLGADVRVVEFNIPSLDAVAVWGAKFGPAVLLNKGSSRWWQARFWSSYYRTGSVRVTEAHELCHLLVDSGHTLSAVDILNGRMPLAIEQRAGAFAAEFLLPSAVAAAAWQKAKYPLAPAEVGKVINALCISHGVTASVASWQLEHGVTPFHQAALSLILDQVVPHR